MTTKHSLKEIAFQAGVSLATVDRVIHGRSHVHARTKHRVEAAIADLDAQYTSQGRTSRSFAIDVVMEAPDRFTKAVRHALDRELPTMRPASFRARFHTGQVFANNDLCETLKAIAKRGSHGVLLKARDTQQVNDMVAHLAGQNIPVVTLATDVSSPNRLAYVGMDNARAGASAAWLLGKMLDRGDGILLVQSQKEFMGEDLRAQGFARAMAQFFPDNPVHRITDGAGLNMPTQTLVQAALEDHPHIRAVYSPGGGNRAILAAFQYSNRVIKAFAAHDLDAANRQLLADKKLSFVIHHHLQTDARRVCQHILRFHKMLPQDVQIGTSEFTIVTPFS